MHRMANPDHPGAMVEGERCEWRTDSIAYVGMGFIIVVHPKLRTINPIP